MKNKEDAKVNQDDSYYQEEENDDEVEEEKSTLAHMISTHNQ